jgi:hypothetical protein
VSRNDSDGYRDYVNGSNSDSTSSGTNQTIGIAYIIDNTNLEIPTVLSNGYNIKTWLIWAYNTLSRFY